MAPPIPPRYRCGHCQDWGTVVAPDGKGTVPCPECKSSKTTTNPAPAGPKR
jgi:hypothetical protein